MDVEEQPSKEAHALAGVKTSVSLADKRTLPRRTFGTSTSLLPSQTGPPLRRAQDRTASSGTTSQPCLLHLRKAVPEAVARRHPGGAVDNSGGHIARTSLPQTPCADASPPNHNGACPSLRTPYPLGNKRCFTKKHCGGEPHKDYSW
jgi:hypothetical protein